MRFYNTDGFEVDVQDPSYYIDLEEYEEIKDSINEMLNYEDVYLAQ